MRARWLGLLSAGLLLAAGAVPVQAQWAQQRYGGGYYGRSGNVSSAWSREHDRLHLQLDRARQLWLRTHVRERYRDPRRYARDYAALERKLEQAHARWHRQNGWGRYDRNGGYNGNGEYYPGGGYYPQPERQDNGRHRGWYKGTPEGPPGQYQRNRARYGQQRRTRERDDRNEQRSERRDDRGSKRGQSDDNGRHHDKHDDRGRGHDGQGR